MRFNKTSKSYDDQISLLRDRGLYFERESRARHQLCNVSYYRLSAYFLPFQFRDDPDHSFKPNSTFDTVYRLYLFDRELRLIAMDAIERIEVAIRCKIIYEFSTRYGNNWYEDYNMYSNQSDFNRLITKIDGELARTSENFIRHYNQKYGDPPRPPAWMTLEILSFGQLSIMYKNLKANDAKKAVAEYFGINYTVLQSWMEHLGYIRNLCAHHSRLWNRKLTVKATIPKVIKGLWIDTSMIRRDKAYLSFSIMGFMIKKITPGNYFAGKLRALLHRFADLDPRAAGFYTGWEKDPFWKGIDLPWTYRARIILFKSRHSVRRMGKISWLGY